MRDGEFGRRNESLVLAFFNDGIVAIALGYITTNQNGISSSFSQTNNRNCLRGIVTYSEIVTIKHKRSIQ
jgi:hypothetical protein